MSTAPTVDPCLALEKSVLNYITHVSFQCTEDEVKFSQSPPAADIRRTKRCELEVTDFNVVKFSLLTRKHRDADFQGLLNNPQGPNSHKLNELV